MNDPITIMLLGRPTPGTKARGKFRWLPKRQVDALAEIKRAAEDEMAGREPFTGPVEVAFLFEMPIPVSWSKKKREAAIRGEIWPTQKPDLKNLVWLVEDGLTGKAYADDKQICRYVNSTKRYGVQPKLVVTIRSLV